MKLPFPMPPISRAVQTEIDSLELDRLPTPIPLIAKGKAVSNLIESLVTKCHFSRSGACAIANAVVDPAEFRRHLDSVIQLRVPGGTLTAVQAKVWTPRVSVDCSNPRAANRQDFQFGWRDGYRGVAPIGQPLVRDGKCELVLRAHDKKHVQLLMVEARDEVQAVNGALLANVPAQGVMVPVVLAVVHFEHGDTGESICSLVTVDGSSRLTACQTALATVEHPISPSCPLYRYNGREFSALMHQVRDEYESLDPAHFSEQTDKLRRNRSAIVPAYVIVGYVKDHLPKAPDFAQAIQAYRGLCHVAPPKAWDDAGQRDSMGESAIQQLVVDGVLTQMQADYMRGTLQPREAAEAQMDVNLDVRAALVLRYFSYNAETCREIHQAISRGIKAVRAGSETEVGAAGVGKVSYALRCKNAAELMIRPIRRHFSSAYVNTVRSALERALTCNYFRSSEWGISKNEPEELLDKALDEFSSTGKPGPFSVELAAMGIFWLCLGQCVSRASSQRQEATIEWKEPATVVKELMESRWGLHVFFEAVVQGRAFGAAFSKKRQVDRSEDMVFVAVDQFGNRELAPDGSNRNMSVAWIKETVLGQMSVESAEVVLESPEQEYDRLWIELQNDTEKLAQLLVKLEQVRDEAGRPMYRERGLFADTAQGVARELQRIALRIATHALRNEELGEAYEAEILAGRS